MSLPLLTRLALAAQLSLLLNTAAQAAGRELPYEKVAQMSLTLKKVDPQRICSVIVRAQPGAEETELPVDLKMQVRVDGKDFPFAVEPGGRLALPIREDWADKGAVLQINVPKSRVQLGYFVDCRTPPGTRMTYAQLTESVPVLERGIKEMAGMMSFMAPKVRQLNLQFDSPGVQTVSLTLPGGKKRLWKSDAKGHASLPWDPSWLAGMVELTAPLKGIDQVLK